MQQENAKKLVPENTDAAMLIRNKCFTYVHSILTAKDIAYYDDKAKLHTWALSTVLKGIR